MPKQRRTSRRAARSAKTGELERLEKLLGEEFESLSEARKALKAETGAVPGKKKYSIKELSSRKHRTIKTLIPDLEGHSKELDALKKPQDFWAAEIYGHKTYTLYGSMEQLARKLASYKGLQEEHPGKALKNVKILRVSGVNALADYHKQKQLEVKESWRRTKAKGKVDRGRQRKQKKQIEKMAEQIKELKRKLKAH